MNFIIQKKIKDTKEYETLNVTKPVTIVIIKIIDVYKGRDNIIMIRCTSICPISSMNIKKGDDLYISVYEFGKCIDRHPYFISGENEKCLIGGAFPGKKTKQIRNPKYHLEHNFLLLNKIRVSDVVRLTINNNTSTKSVQRDIIQYYLNDNKNISVTIRPSINSDSDSDGDYDKFNDLLILRQMINDVGKIKSTIGYIWMMKEENLPVGEHNKKKSRELTIVRITTLTNYNTEYDVVSENKYFIIGEYDTKDFEYNEVFGSESTYILTCKNNEINAVVMKLLSYECDFVCSYYKKTSDLLRSLNNTVVIKMHNKIDPYSNVRELTWNIFNENIFTVGSYDINLMTLKETFKYVKGVLLAKHSIFMSHDILRQGYKIAKMTCSNMQTSINAYPSELSMNLISTAAFSKNRTRNYYSFTLNDEWAKYNKRMCSIVTEDSNGGYIDAIRGIYKNVVSIDYTSCYPMVMIDNNLCITNVRVNPSKDEIKKMKLVKRCSIETKDGPADIYTPPSEVSMGLIPQVLKKLYAIKCRSTGTYATVVKLLMNCIYGNLGSRNVGFESKIIAYAVCKIQREKLKKIKMLIENSKSLKFVQCVTDGIMMSIIEDTKLHSLMKETSNDNEKFQLLNNHLSEGSTTKVLDDQRLHVENVFKKIFIKNPHLYVGIRSDNNIVHNGLSIRKSGIFVRDAILCMYEKILKDDNLSQSGISVYFNANEIKKIPLSWFVKSQKLDIQKNTSDHYRGQLKRARDIMVKSINDYTFEDGVSRVNFITVKNKKHSSTTTNISVFEYDSSEWGLCYSNYIGEILSELKMINEVFQKNWINYQHKESPLLSQPNKCTSNITQTSIINGSKKYGYLSKLSQVNVVEIDCKYTIKDICFKCKNDGVFNSLSSKLSKTLICDNSFCTQFTNKLFF